jgi:hypothetical protein
MFHAQKRPSKYRPECKECTLKRSREAYRKSRERYLASARKQWGEISADEAARAGFNEGQRRRRKENPELARRQDIARTARRYGLTPDAREALLAFQGGVCAICGRDPADGFSRRYHIDHDHKTGIVRGILCASCNVALGGFKDDPVRLAAAIRYLQDPPAARKDPAA